MSRIRKQIAATVPRLFGSEPLSAQLKHQARYGTKPWQPGEIPGMRQGTRIINQPLDIPAPPYGEFFAVEKPVDRGIGYSPIDIVDVEGNESNHKQTGSGNGVRILRGSRK